MVHGVSPGFLCSEFKYHQVNFAFHLFESIKSTSEMLGLMCSTFQKLLALCQYLKLLLLLLRWKAGRVVSMLDEMLSSTSPIAMYRVQIPLRLTLPFILSGLIN
ncbi:Hypothetical predicted protein [Octopus vulgaris]|uniref:Uncharacterized protein n=1 Tax=Octopus vulgaris TaxID=6645 RepID=A0AA36B195_OCTVU|nr:Hypothetical predicted protein [Octopus vulgaris]